MPSKLEFTTIGKLFGFQTECLCFDVSQCKMRKKKKTDDTQTSDARKLVILERIMQENERKSSKIESKEKKKGKKFVCLRRTLENTWLDFVRSFLFLTRHKFPEFEK